MNICIYSLKTLMGRMYTKGYRLHEVIIWEWATDILMVSHTKKKKRGGRKHGRCVDNFFF
jgi:hypothetical protein